LGHCGSCGVVVAAWLWWLWPWP